MKRGIAVLPSLLLALTAAVAAGQQTRDDGFILRVNGPVTIAAGESVDALFVIDGDANVEGVVRGALVVVNGRARIGGEVGEDVVVARGHVELGPDAVVGQDVLLFSSTMAESEGSRVLGRVHSQPGVSFSARAGWLLWLSITLLCVAGGLLFAGLAGNQLVDSVKTLVQRPGPSSLGALALMFGLPAIAMFAIVTVIGMPIGFTILFAVLPAVAFLGYIVTGTMLGAALVRSRATGRFAVSGRMYTQAAVGIVVLQIAALVPWIGGLAALMASLAGAGALVVRTWSVLRGAPVEEEEPEQVPLPL